MRLCADADVLDEAPVGVHPGVLCDKTLNPITGWRFTDGAGYDLCEAEFLKLEPAERSASSASVLRSRRGER